MTSAPLRLSPIECTCFRLRGAARRVTQIYSQHLGPTGLKISQFSLLGFVAAEGPVAIGRLSELLATDRTTLTRNLKPLLAEGLVERAPSGDKRRHELAATAAGLPCSSAPCRCGPGRAEVRDAMGPKLTADLQRTRALDGSSPLSEVGVEKPCSVPARRWLARTDGVSCHAGRQPFEPYRQRLRPDRHGSLPSRLSRRHVWQASVCQEREGACRVSCRQCLAEIAAPGVARKST